MKRAPALAVALCLASPAGAGTTSTGSILPPGMRSLTIDLKRDPDVRCVVPNCFPPPVIRDRPRRNTRSQREFERRLLSPSGRGRLE